MTSWSNWSGRIKSSPATQISPSSEDEIASAIVSARDRGQVVRARGTGHSNTPLCATDDVLVSLESLSGLVSFDQENLTAVVRSGTTLNHLSAALHLHGLALHNLGDIDAQTIAGAVGTATHGTGTALSNLASAVEGTRVVLADGSVVACSRSVNIELFAALTPSLGAVGIITEFTIRVVPSYRLHEKIWFASGDTAIASLEANIAATRHYEFFWHPSRDLVEHKALALTESAPNPLPDTKRERIDYSHRILPSVRSARFNEMEYSLPYDNGPACFAELRKRMIDKWPNIEWPVEYRTVASDDLMLSPHSGRPSVTISVHQGGDKPCDDLFRDTEQLLRGHGGRPHWGKVHYNDGNDLRSHYPGWDEWWNTRDRFDPEGVFLNPYLAALRTNA